MIQEDGLIFKSDSYKYTHWPQYPKGTTKVISYLESRGGLFDNTLFYGLQYILKKHFEGIVITKNDVIEAKFLIDRHIGPGVFNFEGWMRIVDFHGGKIPIRIKAVPEGTVVKTKNVLMLVENTDDKLPWITNFCESILLQSWYPITVGTLSMEIKRKFIKYLEKTTSYTREEMNAILAFMLNDFGYRGASSHESASIGGSAHLVNFFGTDNISAIRLIQKYYNCPEPKAYSVPASEHSTITSWGRENEVKAFENMLDSFPTGIVSCVSDSFNILKACEKYWGEDLKDKILSRDGRLVIRPDSGDPIQTLKRIFHILWDKFGGKVNDKGFKVLDPHVRVIQGDGINFDSIDGILDMMVDEGFSVENIVFGMGGALLQKIDRDTQKFAFKCCCITIDGEEFEVVKDPLEIDENGNETISFKKSKSGRLKLVNFDGNLSTVEHAQDEEGDVMVEVFKNGSMIKTWTFDEVQERAKYE